MSGIVHLNVHSWYTLLGATPPVAALAARAAEEGLSYLALTDTNVLYGAVAFHRASVDAGVQPLIGMSVLVEAPPGVAGDGSPGTLTLIAAGAAGYRSLCRLSSTLQAAPERGTRNGRLTWDELKCHHEGLFCLSGGRNGWIDRLLRRSERSLAGRAVSQLAGVFGERAWLALEMHGEQDRPMANEVSALAARFGLGTVAVQPIFCLEPEDRQRLRLLAAIARNKRLEDLTADELPDGGDQSIQLHWPAPDELGARFAAFPAALDATRQIASACRPALPDGRPIWPVLELPGGETVDTALARQAYDGLHARYGAEAVAHKGALLRRLDQELAAIAAHGFSPLFLLVADVVRFARSHDIPVSTRGSVANSLVAYCAGITTVDPIAHDLLFERFLNPARSSLPDIDLDFCSIRRDEVLEYIRRTYGADRVALVATISTLRLRSALRETAKAYGLDNATMERLVRRLPEDWHPDPRRRTRQTLDSALEKVEDRTLHPVVRAAFGILHQPDHLSVHPGGVVITPAPLTDYVPVQWAPKGFLITQFDHADVEAIGLPKMDLLGIRALTVLADAAEMVRTHYDPSFRVDTIPFDDAMTGNMLEAGDTIGVFQCESSGAQRTLRQLKARSVQDLAIANAFFKPGPALGGMAQHFIRRYRGEEPVTYQHPALEPILRRTKGVLIFQEQILRIAREIAGLSWEEADHLRKGMSKFQGAEMEAIRERFVQGCLLPAPGRPAMTESQARTLWEQVEPFAGYGFNQGHATAYADVSYRSAYVRAHWPAAFLCARLANWGGYHHASTYIAEARRLGVAVRPPHVNHSRHEFSLALEPRQPADGVQPVLYMGLNQVRDVRQTTIQAILDERTGASFAGLADLVRRVSLQPKELSHLIQCGALDGLGASRSALLHDATHAARRSMQQMSFAFAMQQVQAESAAQRLAWEQHILGQPVSTHPLDLVNAPAECVALDTVAACPRQAVQLLGVRLPGWTGGKGFFLADRTHYVTAVPPRSINNPTPWTPLHIWGRWLQDEWGSGWLQIERLEKVN